MFVVSGKRLHIITSSSDSSFMYMRRIIICYTFSCIFHFGILTIYIELEGQKLVYIGFWGRGIACTYFLNPQMLPSCASSVSSSATALAAFLVWSDQTQGMGMAQEQQAEGVWFCSGPLQKGEVKNVTKTKNYKIQ